MDQNATRSAAARDLPVSLTFGMLAVSFLIFVCLVYLHCLCICAEKWQGKESPQRLPLPVVPYRRDSEANSDCVVCLVDFEEEEEVKILGCGHLFHPECIEQWILHHCSCPVCRSSDIFGENHRVRITAAGEESGVEVVVEVGEEQELE